MKKDLFPHSLDSVAGLTLQAAIDGAEMHAVKHQGRTAKRAPRYEPPPNWRLAAINGRSEYSPKQELQVLEAQLAAIPKVFKTNTPGCQQLIDTISRRIEAVKAHIAAAAIALCMTLAGFLVKEPTNHALSLPKAPHEAEPSTTPPDVTDDAWRGPSFWA